MSVSNVEQALENIYTSLHNNNEAIDTHIESLKAALAPSKEALIDTSRLPHPNREGRKMMQAYFKKRGLTLSFTKLQAETGPK